MYKLKFTLLLCFLCWLPSCRTGTDSAETASRSLYVFGDSWIDLMEDEQIERELADRNLLDSVEVIKHGAGGTTADDWANDEGGLLSDMLDELASDERPNPVFFVTLGGNDVLQRQESGDAIAEDMVRIVEQISAERPDAHVVYGSYDLVNPAIQPEACDERFTAVFGTPEVSVLHSYFEDVFTTVASVLNSAENVTTVNAIGSLNGQPGNADLNSVSPIEYLADCIHLSDEGHSIYLDTIFEEALLDLLEAE